MLNALGDIDGEVLVGGSLCLRRGQRGPHGVLERDELDECAYNLRKLDVGRR